MKDWKGTGSIGTVGIEVVLSIAAGWLAGRWLDRRFETEPWLSLLGFAFGIAAAVKAIVRTWREMHRIALREEREEGNPAPVWQREAEPEEPPAHVEQADDDGASGDGEPAKGRGDDER